MAHALPLLCFSQAPKLSHENPLEINQHINSKNLILDYLITNDATCSLTLESKDSEPLYFLKDKFMHKGQYELSISEKQFKLDTSYIKLNCSYGIAELTHIITREEESPKD